MNRYMRMAVIGAVLSVLLVACGDDSSTDTTAATTPTDATATTEVPATTSGATTAAAGASEPDELSIGLVLLSQPEDPWHATMVDAITRAQESQPHGLDISLEWFENISYADAERILGDLAVSGKYDMIIAHSAFSDAVAAVKDTYPDILFAFAGSGNEPTGGNGYWIDVFIHEPAYLTGIAAGMMTETNKIGAVAAFPFPNVNLPMNAYIAGAQSVNPGVEVTVTYIESWFDPVTAKDSAIAQIAAGVDVIYAERFGPFEAVVEAGVLGIGHFADQEALAPDSVITSALARWDPALNSLIDTWWDHVVNGTGYDAPMERIMFLMAEGGGDIAPLNDALVSTEVQDAVDEAREKILSGELEVLFNDVPVE